MIADEWRLILAKARKAEEAVARRNPSIDFKCVGVDCSTVVRISVMNLRPVSDDPQSLGQPAHAAGTVCNRWSEQASLDVLPTLWFCKPGPGARAPRNPRFAEARTPAGDEALRSVLVVGATSVIQHALRSGKASPWLAALLKRKSPKLAAVALANKTARIAWKMMLTGEAYSAKSAVAA